MTDNILSVDSHLFLVHCVLTRLLTFLSCLLSTLNLQPPPTTLKSVCGDTLLHLCMCLCVWEYCMPQRGSSFSGIA